MAEKGEETRKAQVLQGDMHQLPLVNSQIVRIFTSSTFTDTMQERNSLIEKVYPEIQQHCRSKYGLEFQVIDMRWGVTDDVTDDHQTTALCLQEIENCQKMSAGPNFVTFLGQDLLEAFLGQRHGSQPFPTQIDQEELRVMIEQLKGLNADVDILKTWFVLDENAIPPVYVLQPISSRIPDFLAVDETKKKEARSEWGSLFRKMQILLRQGAKHCQEKGILEEDITAKYFKSVTETEIDHGIFKSLGDPNERCLCFVRIIEDIMNHLSHEKAPRFIDMIGSDLDEEAQIHLIELRDQRLANAVKTLHSFKVMWKDVVESSPNSLSDYLEKFTDLFKRTVLEMIDRNITFSRDLAQDELFSEALQHLHMVKDRCVIFHGRDDVLENIKTSVKQVPRFPIIIYGRSGCGKTSVMAKCVELLPNWLTESKQKPVIVTRLLGTTPMSTNILQVMTSICRQIAECYGVKDVETFDEISGLSQTLQELMSYASNDRPLCLILDSLDQLSSQENAYKLNWLPRKLPQHVTMILSTLPDMHGLMEMLQKRYSTGTFIEIPSLGEETCQEILRSWLAGNKRQLTKQQMQIVQDAFSNCSLALYVKLVFDEVLSWRSYTNLSDIHIHITIREVIYHLFCKLRKKFGTTFVDHTLGYITASKSGISEIEIEDVLSLDDVVLTDVFQYHVPPIRRIPQLLWLRLKNDINSYLVNREADGIRVIYWYHRQFIEAAESFFLGDENKRRYFHQNLAHYYLGTWHNKNKHFCYNEYQMKKLNLDKPDSSADRKVAAQPLVFFNYANDGLKTTRDNIRKLNNMPYHIHHMGKDDLLRKECLYDYKWLLQKIKAISVQALLFDFELLSSKTESDKYLSAVMRMSKATLNVAPTTLAIEIIGSLLPYGYLSPELERLLGTCYIEGSKDNALVPRQQCYNAPGGPCIHVLEHAALPGRKRSLALTCDPAMLGALAVHTNTLLIWDVEEGELLQEVCLWQEEEPKFNVLSLDSDGEKFLCACAFQTTVNPIAIFDTKSEDLTVIEMDKCYPKIGFIDSFNIDIVGDKVIICVAGKECDCFDLNGQLLYSFEVQPTSMHIISSTFSDSKVAVIPSKTEPVFVTYDFAGKTITELSRTKLGSVVKQMVVSTDMDIFVRYNDSLELDWLKHKGRGHFEICDTINISKRHSKPLKIQEFKVYRKHLLFITSDRLTWWKMSKKEVEFELNIPEKLIQSDRRFVPLTAHVTFEGNLIFCAYDNYIIVWDLYNGRLLKTIKASSLPLTDFLIGHCGGTNVVSDALITATAHYKSIKVWDVSKADLNSFQPLAMPNAGRYISLAEETDIAVVRGRDVREIKVVDLKAGKFSCGIAEGHDSKDPWITCDGKYITVTNYDMEQTIRVYSGMGQLLHVLPKFSIYLKAHTTLGSNLLLATHEEISPSEGVHTNVWDLSTGCIMKNIEVTSGGIRDMFFAKNSTLLVTHQIHPFTQLNQNTVIHVYDIKTGKEIVTIPGLMPDSIMKPVPKSNYALAMMSPGPGEELKSFAVIDVTTGKIIAKHPTKANKRMNFNISADGRRAVDSELRVIDIFTGETIIDLSDLISMPTAMVNQLAPRVTMDGKYVVWAVASENLLNVVRIADGKVIGVCNCHSPPSSFVVSKDNIVVMNLYDGRIMFFSIIDCKETHYESDLMEIRQSAMDPIRQFDQTLVGARSDSCLCCIL